MDLTEVLGVVGGKHEGTLVTIRSNGRPQISNVLHTLGTDGVVRISTVGERAKIANVRRMPWAALHVNGPDFWSYGVVEGPVSLSAATEHTSRDTRRTRSCPN
jgi:PPOX class probable F420-dependent enzyme